MRPYKRLHDPVDQFRRRQHTRFVAQCNFRKEPCDITLEQYLALWSNNWDRRGRASDDMCLTREDFDRPWTISNVVLMTRKDFLAHKNAELKRRFGTRTYTPRKSKNAE